MSLFEEKIDTLEDRLERARSEKTANLPKDWQVVKHDRALLWATSEHGIGYLKQLKHADEYGFTGMKITKKKLLRRLEWLCTFFKDEVRGPNVPSVSVGQEVIMQEQFPEEPGQPLKSKYMRKKELKSAKVVINYDPNGRIIFPIDISNSLKILSLGYIDHSKPFFHNS